MVNLIRPIVAKMNGFSNSKIFENKKNSIVLVQISFKILITFF
jgi:hypothetical protein